MTRHRLTLLVVVLVALVGAAAVAARPAKAPAWKIVWHDDFNGAAGKKPDAKRWTYDIGNLHVNNELEYYTDATRNVRLDGHGKLEIVARKEPKLGMDYTSGRILTKGRYAVKYGRVEARIQIPYGQGLWPAFWMLGRDIDRVGWPACGEVDIMENIGREPAVNHGSAHGPGFSGGDSLTGTVTLPQGKLADGFHTYAIEWTPKRITWFLDGKAYETKRKGDQPTGNPWPFDHPFFLILNVAVGGDWPGSPDSTTTFPQTMKVDYVRVSKRT